MCVLDNNNGGNDTPQLSLSTKYDKLILTSDLPTPRPAWPAHRAERREAQQTNKLTAQCWVVAEELEELEDCHSDSLTR